MPIEPPPSHLAHRPKRQRPSEGNDAHDAEADAEQGVQHVTPVRSPRVAGGALPTCEARGAQVAPLPEEEGKDEGHGPQGRRFVNPSTRDVKPMAPESPARSPKKRRAT